MNLDDIRLIYEYNDWANHRILDTAEQVTPEQFTAPTTDSWGSLHGTLVHLLDSEWSWRLTLQGGGFPPAPLSPADYPTIADVRKRWAEEENAWHAYLNGLTDEAVNSTIHYTTDEGHHRERVIWHCLYHIVNHGMQHRAESAKMLTDYGHSPGELDFTVFLNWRNANTQGKTG